MQNNLNNNNIMETMVLKTKHISVIVLPDLMYALLQSLF